MTQREAIIDYITKFGSITPMEAFADLGITKLATRISEMRKDGMEFRTDTAKQYVTASIRSIKGELWRRKNHIMP